jgi:phosphoribosylglycinamide formyltransferase-1
MDAIGQAINYKVKITGVTVHYVDKGMDTGEIISQQALDISNMHNRSEIEKEIHNIEHILYPKTIKKLLEE